MTNATAQCCKRPEIALMDHLKQLFAGSHETERIVNRCCIRCFTHWYGREGVVERFSRQEWDASFYGPDGRIDWN